MRVWRLTFCPAYGDNQSRILHSASARKVLYSRQPISNGIRLVSLQSNAIMFQHKENTKHSLRKVIIVAGRDEPTIGTSRGASEFSKYDCEHESVLQIGK